MPSSHKEPSRKKRPPATERAWLRAARVAQHLTLQSVADATGVTRQEVSAWEMGTRTPNVKRLFSISLVLQIDPLVLMERFAEESR